MSKLDNIGYFQITDQYAHWHYSICLR